MVLCVNQPLSYWTKRGFPLWTEVQATAQTLRVTPAMEAGITDHVWTVGEVVSLLDKEGKIAA